MNRLILATALILATGTAAQPVLAQTGAHPSRASAKRHVTPPIPPVPEALDAPSRESVQSEQASFVVRTRSSRSADGAIQQWSTIELPSSDSPSAGLFSDKNVPI